MKILIPMQVSDLGVNYLKDKGYEIVRPVNSTEASICEAVVDCDGLLTRTDLVTKKVITSSDKLKVVGKHGVGVDNIDLDACMEAGVYVTNAPVSNMISVAEHTMALILALSKKIVTGCNAQKSGDHEFRSREVCADLCEKKIAIIGLGRIGSTVAKMCHLGFDMKILGYDPYIKNVADYITMYDTIEETIKDADYISLHMPSTKENKRFFDKKYFDLMKNSACIINCARGEILNEDDLLIAIENNEIAGAGLDVFEIEPPLANNPLFKLDNVIVTPHNAALTTESKDRMGLHAAIGIDEVLSGKKISYPVVVPNTPRK